MKSSSHLHYGYYVFLGLGDYHQPKNLNKNWIATWKLEDWKFFFENLIQLKATTLMIYSNGHLLPYQSHCYPELSDPNHPNVKKEFFSKVLSLAQSYGLNTIIVLTTTGHSGKYLEKNPDLSIKTRSKKINLEELLSPFPDHIRKTKNLALSGSAQVRLGTLCHNNLKTQEYAANLIKECLSIYPQINGVALHPPESIYPCFCECCSKLFETQYKKNMLETNDDTAREFYLESYLIFQKMILEKKIKKLLPRIQLYTFTVPWLFEKSFKKIGNHISKDTILIDWDYNLNDSRVNQLSKRLLDYQRYGHRIWFMPTAGFGFDENKEAQHQIDKVKEQIEIAINSKVSGIAHFVGPTIRMGLEKTNFNCSPSENHCVIRSKL